LWWTRRSASADAGNPAIDVRTISFHHVLSCILIQHGIIVREEDHIALSAGEAKISLPGRVLAIRLHDSPLDFSIKPVEYTTVRRSVVIACVNDDDANWLFGLIRQMGEAPPQCIRTVTRGDHHVIAHDKTAPII